MDDDFVIINRKIIKVGNSYAVALAPSKVSRFGFELGTSVQVVIRDGLVIITREGEQVPDVEKQLVMSELSRMDATGEQLTDINADEQNLQGLNELSLELGHKSLSWANQRVRGYNSNLRLGDKRRRAVIREEQVVVLNLDLMNVPRFPISINGTNFPALKGLRITGCQLRELDLSNVGTLPLLEKLVLSSNEIDEIELEPLAKLNKLTTLYLNGNLLDRVNLQPLQALENIESINLSSNELEEIDLSPLAGLKGLKELYLHDNFLTDIDLDPLMNMDNLQIGLPGNLTSRTREQVQVLQKKGAEFSVAPFRKLTTANMFNLPHDLQELAMTMLSLEEGTVEEIAEEADLAADEVLEKLSELQKLGYIGIIQREGKTVYYRSSK